jgi:hypothetical protein
VLITKVKTRTRPRIQTTIEIKTFIPTTIATTAKEGINIDHLESKPNASNLLNGKRKEINYYSPLCLRCTMTILMMTTIEMMKSK